VKIRTKDHATGRTSDGRVYSAMAGTETVVDDDDEGMVALMKQLAASGVVEIVGDEPEQAEEQAEEEAEEEAEVSQTRYEDKTVLELRDLARERGLPVGGSKDDLIARLQEETA
jgi:hypothetical protein